MHRDVKPHNVMIDHQQKKVPLQPGSKKPFPGGLRADHHTGQYLVVSDTCAGFFEAGDSVICPVSNVGFYFA